MSFNHVGNYRRWLFLVVAAGLVSTARPASAVVIDNDLPSATVGSWAVDVTTGGETRTALLTANRLASADTLNTDIIFDYFSYVDPGNDGAGFRLAGTAPTVDAADPDKVTSSGTFTGADGNTIDWTVVSSIADGSPVMRSVFTFSAETGALGTLRFLQYMDEDVQGPGDDVFFTRGSAATNDLQLFTVDNAEVYGVSHSGGLSAATGLVHASFAGWAADQYNNMKPRIESVGQSVSLNGVIANLNAITHAQVGDAFGPADIVSVLTWDVDPAATQATIVTTLGGVPDVSQVQCGNGTIEGNEECDDANTVPTDGCTNDCTICGNGVVTPPEECDDENLVDGDGCSSSCRLETGLCGNGELDPGEQCDGAGNDDACPDACLSDCTCPAAPVPCGNNELDVGEECDGASDSACPGACLPPGDLNECQCPACGDGEANGREQCDGEDDSACPGLCTSECTCQSVTPAALDAFLCYRARAVIALASPPEVSLVDRFGSSVAAVDDVDVLCAPASQDDDDPTAPTHAGHLEGYAIGGGAFTPVNDVVVTDRFGTLVLDVKEPLRLQVPTAKSRVSPPAPLAPGLDHFQCYRVHESNAAHERFRNGPTLTIEDQIGTTSVQIRRPRQLCVPVDKNGETPGAEGHADDLVCYDLRVTDRARFDVNSPFFVLNQFGRDILRLRKPQQLCVPAREGAPELD